MIATLAVIAGFLHPFTFTAPAKTRVDGTVVKVEAYRFYRRDRFGITFESALYSANDITAARPAPKNPGEQETVWAPISEDGEIRLYWVTSLHNGIESPPSNPIALGGGVKPDTAYVDVTADFRTERSALGSSGKWFVRWVRKVGEFVMVPLPRWALALGSNKGHMSLTEFQERDAPQACWTLRAVGQVPQWAEGGRWRMCP